MLTLILAVIPALVTGIITGIALSNIKAKPIKYDPKVQVMTYNIQKTDGIFTIPSTSYRSNDTFIAYGFGDYVGYIEKDYRLMSTKEVERAIELLKAWGAEQQEKQITIDVNKEVKL